MLIVTLFKIFPLVEVCLTGWGFCKLVKRLCQLCAIFIKNIQPETIKILSHYNSYQDTLLLQEPDNFGWASVFLLFFQILD